jgi:hypothetical protein
MQTTTRVALTGFILPFGIDRDREATPWEYREATPWEYREATPWEYLGNIAIAAGG